MGYLQFGRHGVRKIIRSRDISYDNVVVNPLLFASQGFRYKRKLQVILTTDIDKLGKAGDTVKVAPGYFRNHLMPKLLAFPNSDKFAYLLNEQRKVFFFFKVARQLCVNIAADNLHLPLPLSTLGEYEVPLRLPISIPLPEGKANWSLKVKIRSK
ncbi:uncharacterized protein LOC106776656 [Vigna radiata var. radiata]|uniref:Large ribosomal subunit protein bL9c n=1 Tax=Vigna radiata var. radiata TaxID=3916 RepID=A0A3Q0ELX5_VIGRR|nr:uncharacterized protein LOC106776656 [Vigna radiata var. radiata]